MQNNETDPPYENESLQTNAGSIGFPGRHSRTVRGWNLRISRLAPLLCCALASLPFAGCQPGDTDSDASGSAPAVVQLPDMRVGIVGDPVIGAVFARQWSATHESGLEFVDITESDFAEAEFRFPEPVDVIVYPATMIGDIVSANRIIKVPGKVWNDSEQVNTQEILRHSRRTMANYRKEPFAVPLGMPTLTMMIREDVLNALETGVPETWSEFQSLAEAVRNSAEGGTDLPTGILIPTADGWGANMLLARVASSIRVRGSLSAVFDRNTMAPLIATDPFVSALQALKESVDSAEPLSVAEVYQQMIEGKAAIGFTWPSIAFELERPDNAPDFDFAITRLPGSSEVFTTRDGWTIRPDEDDNHVDLIGFDGLVASISRDAPHTLDAQEVLKWLPAKTTSLKSCPVSIRSGPFRASHLGTPRRWTGDSLNSESAQRFADTVKESNEATVCLVFPRIPGRSRYLQSLDEAVLSFLNGDSEAEEALMKAAATWDEITESIGRSQQKEFLKSSQGS